MGILRKLADSLAPAAEPPAPDSPGSWLMLSPGKHTVDGVAVEVPDNGQLAVPFETTRGKHIVDGRVAIAPDMSPSIPR